VMIAPCNWGADVEKTKTESVKNQVNSMNTITSNVFAYKGSVETVDEMTRKTFMLSTAVDVEEHELEPEYTAVRNEHKDNKCWAERRQIMMKEVSEDMVTQGSADSTKITCSPIVIVDAAHSESLKRKTSRVADHATGETMSSNIERVALDVPGVVGAAALHPASAIGDSGVNSGIQNSYSLWDSQRRTNSNEWLEGNGFDRPNSNGIDVVSSQGLTEARDDLYGQQEEAAKEEAVHKVLLQSTLQVCLPITLIVFV
jgi:hypothetical protein